MLVGDFGLAEDKVHADARRSVMNGPAGKPLVAQERSKREPLDLVIGA